MNKTRKFSEKSFSLSNITAKAWAICLVNVPFQLRSLENEDESDGRRRNEFREWNSKET